MQQTSKIQKELLYLLLSSLVVVVCWIGFGIYNTAITSTITQDLQTQIQPIDPTFDIDTLNKLKTRQQISPAFAITGTPTSPTPSIASISASLTPVASQSATSSGSGKLTGH